MGGKTPYAKVKEWREKNKDKVLEQSRRRRARSPEKVRAQQARWIAANKDRVREMGAKAARKRRAADPEGQRRRQREWRDRILKRQEKQAGRPRPLTCEICGGNGVGCHPNHKIVFDHCHETGLFRGWLCDRCNKVLGLVKDSPELLVNLSKYLEDFYGKINRG